MGKGGIFPDVEGQRGEEHIVMQAWTVRETVGGQRAEAHCGETQECPKPAVTFVFTGWARLAVPRRGCIAAGGPQARVHAAGGQPRPAGGELAAV